MSIKTLIIPRVFVKINQSQIRETLEALNLGIIERIDVKKGEKFNRVFIRGPCTVALQVTTPTK